MDVLESTNCAAYPAASSANPWSEAFQRTYAGVASQCSEPTGKNRHHKFKDKVVEIWEGMEVEVLQKRQSIAHPLYGMAMKQLKTYRSVSADKSLRSSGKKLPPVRSANRKRPDAKSAASPFVLAQPEGLSDTSFVTANDFRAVIDRLETSISFSKQTPTLPSPLEELHRIVMRTTEPEELEMLQPHYRDALGKYLNQVAQQAASSSHPGMLPAILEGLQFLRSSFRFDSPVAESGLLNSIQYTYRQVLSRYLHLSNPTLSPEQENDMPSKKKARTDDDDKDQEEIDGKGKSSEAESMEDSDLPKETLMV